MMILAFLSIANLFWEIDVGVFSELSQSFTVFIYNGGYGYGVAVAS